MMRRSRFAFSGLIGNGIIGIRREDKNVWERRVALIPSQVQKLLARRIVKKVLVQPSSIRCYPDEDYEEAGAEIAEDLTPAHTICAVKEVPPSLLIPERSYLFFSHTIKAQPYNMPLLDTLFHKNIRLFDYERILGPDGRLVKFGPYAGYAGVLDTLHGVGLALLMRGFSTPLLHLSLAKEYKTLDTAREDLRVAGELIRKKGLPAEICPFTIAVTGGGSVSMAAQQFLHLLPCKYVEVEDLPRIWNASVKDTKHVYVVVVRPKNMVKPVEPSQTFSEEHYFKNPEKYVPIFHEAVAPYVRVLMNCIYWEPRFPRLLTFSQARQLEAENRFPLLALGDITCDVGGAIEFFVKATTIQNPLYVYDVAKEECIDINHYEGKGVIILGVDHLPAEFPRESSTDFGKGVLPLVEIVANSNGTLPLEEQRKQLGNPLFNSIITNSGELTPNYKYIAKMRAENEKTSHSRVLVIGAGMTSGPCVEYLLERRENAVTVLDTNKKSVQHLVNIFGGDRHPDLGAENKGGLWTAVDGITEPLSDYVKSLIRQSDAVISLLPVPLHPLVTKYALENKVPVVTASYISPQMAGLKDLAEKNETVVINEMGLDPGIDIMSSAKMIDTIRQEGGKVLSYVSLCGALPQPEHSDCPLGYKFSWSPRGVLTAATRPTRFKVASKWYDVPGEFLFFIVQPMNMFTGMKFHWLPNGNSEKYAELYNIESAANIVRGTLRYTAYAPVIRAFLLLGLLKEEKCDALVDGSQPITWATLLSSLLDECGADKSPNLVRRLEEFLEGGFKKKFEEVTRLEAFTALREEAIFEKGGIAEFTPNIKEDVAEAIKSFTKLGFLSEQAVPQTPSGFGLDSICSTLKEHLMYDSHERDFVLMVHQLDAVFPNGNKKRYSAVLSLRGTTDSRSATGKTVGLPVGISGQLLLDGKLRRHTGFVHPTDRTLYEPVLRELEARGIHMHETVKDL